MILGSRKNGTTIVLKLAMQLGRSRSGEIVIKTALDPTMPIVPMMPMKKNRAAKPAVLTSTARAPEPRATSSVVGSLAASSAIAGMKTTPTPETARSLAGSRRSEIRAAV